jgi:uncharacterized protein (TIGR02466 family)
MVSDLSSASPFPSLVYKTKFNGELSAITKLALDECLAIGNDHTDQQGGISTYNVLKDAILRPECAELNNFIIGQHKKVWDNWCLQDRPRYVSASWFNLLPPKAWVEEHDHSGMHMVVVVYLKNPVNGSNIQFKDPMNQIWAAYPRDDKQLYHDWKTVEVTTGDILFFPGFLQHRTEVNNSGEDRLVLTINLCIDFFG